MMKDNYFFKRILIIVIFPLIFLLSDCASTPQHTLSPSTFEPAETPNYNQPQTNFGISTPQNSFLHNLPLGIGGRFDLFVSETASEASEFYNDYLAPMRNGNMFLAKPYVVDYAILPDSGDLYRLDNELHDKTVKSDFDFRVGMTRRYSSISDFFKTDFWIARGEYGPQQPKQQTQKSFHDPYNLTIFGQTQPVQSPDPYIEPEFDVQEIINSEWDLPVQMPMVE